MFSKASAKDVSKVDNCPIAHSVVTQTFNPGFVSLNPSLANILSDNTSTKFTPPPMSLQSMWKRSQLFEKTVVYRTGVRKSGKNIGR